MNERWSRWRAVAHLGNGRLGTTMGMGGSPKSAIEIRRDMAFFDMSLWQIEHLNEA